MDNDLASILHRLRELTSAERTADSIESLRGSKPHINLKAEIKELLTQAGEYKNPEFDFHQKYL